MKTLRDLLSISNKLTEVRYLSNQFLYIFHIVKLELKRNLDICKLQFNGRRTFWQYLSNSRSYGVNASNRIRRYNGVPRQWRYRRNARWYQKPVTAQKSSIQSFKMSARSAQNMFLRAIYSRTHENGGRLYQGELEPKNSSGICSNRITYGTSCIITL